MLDEDRSMQGFGKWQAPTPIGRGRAVLVEYLKADQRAPIMYVGHLSLMSEARRRGLRVDLLSAPDSLHAFVKEWGARRQSPSPEAVASLAAQADFQDFFRRIRALDPQVLAFTTYESYLNPVELLLRLLKPETDAYLVVGGPLATTLGEKVLELLSADFAVLGEGEFVFSDLLELIGPARPSRRPVTDFAPQLAAAPAVVARGVARPPGFHQPARLSEEEMEDLQLDFAFALNHLRQQFPAYAENPILSYISSRGCPYACIFCSAVQGKKFRRLSAEKMVADLHRIRDLARDLKERREPFIIAFGDDNFLYDRERAVRFFRLVVKEGLQHFFQFTFQASVDRLFRHLRHRLLDTELVDEALRANVTFLTFGTDNFCDEELRRLRKAPYTREHIHALVDFLESRGVLNNHFCILSNLYTTPANLADNLRTIVTLDRKYRRFIQLRPIMYLAPYYGTPAWEEIMAHPRYRDSQMVRPFLFFPPTEDPVPLGEKVLPLHPDTRRLVERLDTEVETRLVKNIPYYYDFRAALRLVTNGSLS